MITIRANAEWLAWFDALREKHSDVTRTGLIDIALNMAAKKVGLPKAPPRD